MIKKRITTPTIKDANPNTGSQCLRAGDMVFISGQIAHEDGKVVAPGDALAQCRHVFQRMRALVEAAGGGMEDIVSLTIYLTDIRNREATRTARAEVFKDPAPTASVVGGVDLAFEGVLVEIDGIAVLPSQGGR
jgi:enamine deaminase RidA (YjgF/YER057c/UK114 family)